MGRVGRRVGMLVALGMAALIGWAEPARASGDNYCRPTRSLSISELSACDSRAVLGPANDTRINLLLLMRAGRQRWDEPTGPAGARPGPSFDWAAYRNWLTPRTAESESFTSGEGSRCRSNDPGKASFAAAVGAARGLLEADRAALIAARQAFDPDCQAAQALAVPAVGVAARPWAAYLAAAAAFYNGEWDPAARGFGALASARDPWLAETARYMAGRVPLNQAQATAFDEWGEPDFAKADRAALARAQAGFEAYLARHPQGRYALSARGLLRRVWWLSGDRAKLAAAYGALMREDPATRGIDDVALAEEIDHKLPLSNPGSIGEPYLLAVQDLAAMRGVAPTLTAADLAAQRTAFAREPGLYAYLQAAHLFYVARRPADALGPAREGSRGPGPVSLASQVLRGQALDATNSPGATSFWRATLTGASGSLQRSVVELGFALHEERAGRVGALLGPRSELTTPLYRETLLATVADAAMLCRAATNAAGPAHERDVALFVLLYKQLSRGFYADFLRDLALVLPGAATEHNSWDMPFATDRVPVGLFTQPAKLGDLGCAPLKTTATTLAANPRDPHARLCLADFFQANGFDGGDYDAQPDAGALGGTRSLFPGQPYERAAIYRALLADPATPAEDRAYALYRSIRCYAPSGTNTCGGEAVPVTTRRAWFQRLQREFPRSRWAKSPLYW